MRFRKIKCRKCGGNIEPGNVCLICKREDGWRKNTPPPQPPARPTQCPLCHKMTVRGGVCGNPRCP